MKSFERILCLIFAIVGLIFGGLAVLFKVKFLKWIFAILSIGIIIFTLYAAIDAIIKNRRHPY